MTVFKNVIKRILRSKAQLALMLLLPILPLFPIMMDTPAAARSFDVGVVDMDKTELSNAFIKHIEGSAKIKYLEKDKFETSLISSEVDYIIVIDKGFTDNMINTADAAVKGYANKTMDITPIINTYTDTFLGPVKNIARAALKDKDKFYNGLREFLSGKLTVSNVAVEKNDLTRSKVGWGMVIMFMMFSSVFATTLIIADKENKTFYRSLTAPLKIKSYMIQSILAFLIISMLQALVLTLVMVFLFDAYAGVSILNMYILLAAFSVIGVSLGVAVSSFLKTSVQASVVGVLIVVFTCVLSGAWGTGVSSEIVRNIMKFMPVSWGMQAVEELLKDLSIIDITKEIGIMLVFSFIFFLLGTWRKADIAK
jgi:ABC-2 type transport system permease protein